jgi:hypothetical protein
MTDLRKLSLEDLAALLGDADDALGAAILRECDRRDRAEHARRARRADPVAAEWRDAARAQYLAAEAACNGYLLNRRGLATGIDPWSLWSGPVRRAMALASWELREFWESNPRLTIGEYRKQLADARRAHDDERDRERQTLPPLPELVAVVREHGPDALRRYPQHLLEELLDSESAAAWIGIQPRSIYREKTRGRWPESDLPTGRSLALRSLAWKRRTIILHLAARTGRGAPGQERAKRKSA